MSSFKDFFLFCAGVDRKILEKCPSDENKYVGIGATIFFTGVLAFFSAGYALYTVFDSWLAAIAFGTIWGMMIFNLDRYIVSSMKSKGSFGQDFLVAFPRLVLAVLLALVISKPLELKIFQKEIDAELIVMEQEVFKTQEDRVQERYTNNIVANQEQIKILKSEIETKTKVRDELTQAAVAEADGTGGSQKRNMGPIYRAKKAEADKAQVELDELMATNLPLIAEKEKANTGMESKVQSEISELNRSAYGGLAARMDALDRLGQQSEAILLANIFIMLLFVSVETAPIFVKLISPRSPYDFVLHEHEHVFQMANHENTTMLANAVKNNLKVNTEVGVHRSEAKVKLEKAIIDAELNEKLKDLRSGGYDWNGDVVGV